MYVGHVTHAGVELANSDRFTAYGRALLGGSAIFTDCGCPPLFPGPYTTPDADGAPWYDPNRSESAHFVGVKIEEISGLDSPYQEREVTQSIVGGALGPLRLGPRRVSFRATLFALSGLALDYGLQWVTSVLSGRFCGAATYCNLGDIGLYATCPDPAQGIDCGNATVPVVDETALDLARTLHSGGLLNGPTITNRLVHNGETLAYEITWSVATEVPWMSGTPTDAVAAVSLTANAAVAAESWECPGFVDPCPPVEASGARTACPTSVEQTCDWDDSGQTGPPSWATQTWADTGETVFEESAPCSISLSRVGDAGVHGCQRPSVRVRFDTATGGGGPISVGFEVTEAQGNLNVSLWNPATDTNIPISSLNRPAGSPAEVFNSPTGQSVNARGRGEFRINYSLPSGVDPGTLYLIFHAFGGNIGGLAGTPVPETVEGITLYYNDTGLVADPDCCNLEPGDPIVSSPFAVPCWTDPGSTHRTIVNVNNTGLTTEQALRFTVVNGGGTELANLRAAIYDPTLIGQPAGTVPTVGGVWPGGVEEWECNALIGEFYVPSLPAGETLEADGTRQRVVRYPNGSPSEARSGDRLFYGGADKAWAFRTVPPCAQWAVVVFADSANTDAAATVQIETVDLYLAGGSAQ